MYLYIVLGDYPDDDKTFPRNLYSLPLSFADHSSRKVGDQLVGPLDTFGSCREGRVTLFHRSFVATSCETFTRSSRTRQTRTTHDVGTTSTPGRRYVRVIREPPRRQFHQLRDDIESPSSLQQARRSLIYYDQHNGGFDVRSSSGVSAEKD